MLIGLFAFASACGAGSPKQEDGFRPSRKLSAQQQADHYMELAVIAESEGDLSKAYENYNEASVVLDAAGDFSENRAEAHFLAGEKALALLQFQDAVAHYEAAVPIYLRFEGNSQAKAAVALTNMGAAYKKLDQKDKARACWQRALEIYQSLPEENRSSLNMATIEQNLNDLESNF
jgi:tetratricopeptide (TPR) repeat protein